MTVGIGCGGGQYGSAASNQADTDTGNTRLPGILLPVAIAIFPNPVTQ